MSSCPKKHVFMSKGNIFISDAQYYELNARRNLWCEILEF